MEVFMAAKAAVGMGSKVRLNLYLATIEPSWAALELRDHVSIRFARRAMDCWRWAEKVCAVDTSGGRKILGVVSGRESVYVMDVLLKL